MKLIIDLPDDAYEQAKETWTIHTQDYVVVSLYRAVKNGKPYDERPKGKWTKGSMYGTSWADYGFMNRCSLCGYEQINKSHYCANCGADNQEEEKDISPCISCENPDTKKDCPNCMKWANWCNEE